jgi:hypothetical protein
MPLFFWEKLRNAKTDLSAKNTPPGASAWLSQAHENAVWSERNSKSTEEGSFIPWRQDE